MVRRVFGLVYKEVRGLHQAAYVLALFTLVSQLLALFRDRLLANQFGAGEVLDIYYSAFRVPDLLFVLFASTLSVYVLIPFVASAKSVAGTKSASALLSQIATVFLLFYSVAALILIVLAPFFVPLLFPGIADVATLVSLVQILLLQPFFLGLSSLFGVVTQLAHRFVLYALSPLLYNIGIIFGIIVLYPLMGLSGIAAGVVLGAVAHCAIQLPLVLKHELRFSLTHTIEWRRLREVFVVSIPRAFTLSINQVVLLSLVSLAGTLTIGSVSVFQFAFNLQSVPLAIIGASYSVAAFPALAQLFAEKKTQEFSAYVITALRHIIFWSVPVIVLCVILRAQIVRVILGSGAFDWEDTRLTAAVFAVFIVALVAHSFNLLLVRTYYASGNTRIPLLVSMFGGLLAVGAAHLITSLYTVQTEVAIAIATWLRVADVAGTEVLMIALAYSSALLLQAIVLFALAQRHFTLPARALGNKIAQALFASALGGVACYAALQFFVDGLNTQTFLGIFLQGSLAGLFGVTGVVLGYMVVGSCELQEVRSAINKRIFKVDVIAPQKDII